MVIHFEIWKGRRVVISRDDRNKINTWRYQKGSGIKSKNQAQAQINKTGTFYPDRVRTGGVTTSVSGVDRVTKLGKNTTMISSKREPRKTTAPYQYTAYVSFQKNGKVTKIEGYSNFTRNGGSKAQAFERARGTAVNKGILTYDHVIQFITNERGVAVKGNERVHFKVNWEVQTYIKTEVKE